MSLRNREKRRSCRKKVSLGARLISDGKNCVGFVNNLSKNGIFMTTNPMTPKTNFTLGRIFELKFQTFSGETLCLQCKVKWTRKTPPLGLTDCIGMEIIDPPPKYNEFLTTL